MSDMVVLRGVAVELDSPEGRDLITNACRAAEGLLKDQELAEIYRLSAQVLETLADNPAVGDAIRRERTARVRSGQAAREMAAHHFTAAAPRVLNSLMTSENVHPKFRIESARELKATAFSNDEKQAPANAAEKFVITINLGAGRVETYEKEINPVNRLPPKDPDWGWSELDGIDK